MCSAMAAVIGIQAAGGIMGAAGAQQEAASQIAYYNYLAAQNEVQAQRVLKQGQQEAEEVQYAAGEEAAKLAAETRKLEGVQKTVMAARGVWSNSKTAEDIATDTATKQQRDEAALRYQADYGAWLARANAAETARALREQATGYRFSADATAAARPYKVWGSLLNSAGQIGSTYMNWSRFQPTTSSAPASDAGASIITRSRGGYGAKPSRLSLY